MIQKNNKMPSAKRTHRSMSDKIKKVERTPIWLIDDNREFCIVFSEAVNNSTNIVCTRYFQDGRSAIKNLLTTLDIPVAILLDINMPKMNGIEVLRAIKRLAPDLRLIMLTVNDHDDNIRQALKYGASGYLLKTSSVSEVSQAVHAAIQGGVPMDPFVIRKMLTMFALNPDSTRKYKLTTIEKEIIRHTSEGMKTTDIARQMQLSWHTVRTRLRDIFRKLDVHTRAELAAKSIKENII